MNSEDIREESPSDSHRVEVDIGSLEPATPQNALTRVQNEYLQSPVTDVDDKGRGFTNLTNAMQPIFERQLSAKKLCYSATIPDLPGPIPTHRAPNTSPRSHAPEREITSVRIGASPKAQPFRLKTKLSLSHNFSI